MSFVVYERFRFQSLILHGQLEANLVCSNMQLRGEFLNTSWQN